MKGDGTEPVVREGADEDAMVRKKSMMHDRGHKKDKHGDGDKNHDLKSRRHSHHSSDSHHKNKHK